MTPRSAAAVVAAATTLGLLASGCSSDNGLQLARQACEHVDRSLTVYHQSQEEPGTSASASDQVQAQEQLQDALSFATRAAQQASQWQALETTLSEGPYISESDLTSALNAQCSVAKGNGVAPPPTG